MKTLSLKLKETIFDEVERVVRNIHTSRNAYINEALQFYNKLNQRKLLRKKLQQESKLARAASLEVLSEFEKIIDRIPE